MIDRRMGMRLVWSACAILLLAAGIVAPRVPAPSAAASAPPRELRIGLEAAGTLTWELYVMQRLGLDRRYGLAFRPIRYATKPGAEMALRGGDVEIEVDDWLFATRARAQGIPVQAVDAFSRAVGGVVVRTDGPIRGIADLRGRRVGVTSLVDKSYLILRAVAAAQFDVDPQKDARIFTAAPPLLDQLLRRGDVDAIVQYWQFIPGLVATGRFRELVSTQALLRRIAPGAEPPVLVVTAADETVRAKAAPLRAFLRALREAKRQLASRPELWDDLARTGLVGTSEPGLLSGLIARYRTGVPGVWDHAAIGGLGTVTAELVALAGADVLGTARMDPQAYNVSLSPR